jgi:hypothetical protein
MEKILVYQRARDGACFDVMNDVDTLWLTPASVADLFGVQTVDVMNHLRDIVKDGELQEVAVVSVMKFSFPSEAPRKTLAYNLDAILSIGYRIDTVLATHFRIWATRNLLENILFGMQVLGDGRAGPRPRSRKHERQTRMIVV